MTEQSTQDDAWNKGADCEIGGGWSEVITLKFPSPIEVQMSKLPKTKNDFLVRVRSSASGDWDESLPEVRVPLVQRGSTVIRAGPYLVELKRHCRKLKPQT